MSLPTSSRHDPMVVPAKHWCFSNTSFLHEFFQLPYLNMSNAGGLTALNVDFLGLDMHTNVAARNFRSLYRFIDDRILSAYVGFQVSWALMADYRHRHFFNCQT